jgi:hypothetical protein
MTPTIIFRIWRGDVLRWHHHPDWRLRESGDTVHKHSARMGQMGWGVFGDRWTVEDRDACLFHDTPESWYGDVSYMAKKSPVIRDAHNWAEVDKALELGIPATYSPRVKLCDGVDCLLWAASRGVNMGIGEWPNHIASVKALAFELQVGEAVGAFFLHAGIDS